MSGKLGAAGLLALCVYIAGVSQALAIDSNTVQKWEPPEFCGDHDCPPYKLLHNESAFEIRTYDAADWAVIEPGFRGGPIISTIRAVKHLIRYFKGGNANNSTLDLTVPFVSLVEFGGGKLDANDPGVYRAALDDVDCEFGIRWKRKRCPPHHLKREFGLYIPDKYQGKAPEPLNCSHVHVEHLPEYSLAVRSFGGYATPWRVKHHLHKLFKALDDFDRDVKVDYKKILVSAYSPPFQLHHRHNEVAVIVDIQHRGQALVAQS